MNFYNPQKLFYCGIDLRHLDDAGRVADYDERLAAHRARSVDPASQLD